MGDKAMLDVNIEFFNSSEMSVNLSISYRCGTIAVTVYSGFVFQLLNYFSMYI